MSVRPDGALVIVSVIAMPMMLVSYDCHIRVRWFDFGIRELFCPLSFLSLWERTKVMAPT
jgi:hypothetical protein